MGYYVETVGIDFLIKEENLAAAFEALKELNKRDELKTGGSWSGGEQRECWFAWMPADYDETMSSAREVFEELGFDCEEDEGLRLLGYDSKSGGEEHFLRAVAPFVEPGSFIEWRGEEGEMWRQEFDGAGMHTKSARVVWE